MGQVKDQKKDFGPTDLYQQLALVVGDVLFEVEPETGNLNWFGDPASLLLGYAPGELQLTKETLKQLVAPEDRIKLEQALDQLLHGEKVNTDIRLTRQDGEPGWVQIAGGSVKNPARKASRVIGILRDTQELHEALVSLYEARRMETVGNMASGIAHEFNNHLTPISGYIELTMDHLGPDHPMSEGLQTALERVHYCADLVSQIQTYERKSMLMPESVDVARLIPPTVRLALSFFPGIDEKIAIKEEWTPDMARVWVDQGQFQQALLHLIRNAIEAMPDGGTLTVKAESVSRAESSEHGDEAGPSGEDRYARISVIDTGKGIRPEDRSHIFEPFFTTHGRAMARGMGLPMVQGMVAQNEGWIEIETKVGKGTTVAMYLPQAKDVESASGPTMDADGTMKVESAAAPSRMLVADDEVFIRRLIHKVFDAEGWNIDEANDYDEVIALLEKNPDSYSFVVLDLTMPGCTTEDAIRKLSETQPDARVLFVSGYARDERIERLLKMVPSDFISKPFSPKSLVTVVDELLAE